MVKHFLSYFEETIKKYWDAPALSDFDGDLTLSYGQTAETIAKLHILFKEAGIEKGDKIAICGRNSAHWAVSFLAITTYEAVAVSILADFSANSVHALVNHSDSKFFMVGDIVWQGLDKDKMPNLLGIICMKDFELLYAANKKFEAKYKDRDNLFKSKYPQGFGVTDVSYPIDNLEDVALINYTSGTTSDPKGVVLSYKSISSNVQFGQDRIPNKPGWSMVSMLPLAHMFGLTFEFLYQLAGGCHVYFLSKTPSPQVLMKAFAEVHPYMILTVPLVIEKIFKKTIFPAIKKPIVRELWYIPGINTPIRRKVRDKLMQAFGGNLRHLIIGGAALNHEVENCLKQINFCYTVGYGMTECGPILGYEDWQNFKKRSCGKVVDRMTATIDSNNPEKSVGEIVVKGDNVMMGYYKNPEATAAIFTSDGWMRTGDLGIIDKDGNIFIRGRNKSVIIGSSGQNIYPEEIEDKLNNIPGILESVVVDRGGYLTALVFPDNETLKEEQETKSMEVIMNGILVKLNKLLPPFCRVKQIELVDKEFEKTPKRSIKRFMYK